MADLSKYHPESDFLVKMLTRVANGLPIQGTDAFSLWATGALNRPEFQSREAAQKALTGTISSGEQGSPNRQNYIGDYQTIEPRFRGGLKHSPGGLLQILQSLGVGNKYQ